MSDAKQQALQIAQQIARRRAAGETIADEDVLREHPHLQDELAEQLRRVRFLAQAREQSLNQTMMSPIPAAPEFDRLAADDPDDDFDADTPDSMPDIRVTQREADLFSAMSDIRTTQAVPTTGPVAVPSDTPPQPPAGVQRYRPVHRPPTALLAIYRDNMQSFHLHWLCHDRCVIGRTDCDVVIPHDFHMSSRHAEIQRRAVANGYRWFLVDLESTNGTFVRVDRARLDTGDELLLGGERYRFQAAANRGQLTHTTPDGQQSVFELQPSGEWLGREQGEQFAPFQQDPFLEPRHAYVSLKDKGRWTIKDAGSMNGVWYRIREVELARTCGFQLGEQRFAFILDE